MVLYFSDASLCTCNGIAQCVGGSTQKLLSRSALFTSPGDQNKLLVAAGDESAKAVSKRGLCWCIYLWKHSSNGLFLTCLSPLFHSKSKCKAFHIMEISFIHMWILVHLHVNKTNFHMKGFAVGLTSKQGLKTTRNGPLLCNIQKICHAGPGCSVDCHQILWFSATGLKLGSSTYFFSALSISSITESQILNLRVHGYSAAQRHANIKTHSELVQLTRERVLLHMHIQACAFTVYGEHIHHM